MATIVMFDPRLIALLAEVRNHPTLVKAIDEAELAGKNAHSIIFTFQKGDKDIPVIRTAEEGFGFIAAYAGIALEGDYVMEDIFGICDKVREKLEEKRAPNLYVNTKKELDHSKKSYRVVQTLDTTTGAYTDLYEGNDKIQAMKVFNTASKGTALFDYEPGKHPDFKEEGKIIIPVGYKH